MEDPRRPEIRDHLGGVEKGRGMVMSVDTDPSDGPQSVETMIIEVFFWLIHALLAHSLSSNQAPTLPVRLLLSIVIVKVPLDPRRHPIDIAMHLPLHQAGLQAAETTGLNKLGGYRRSAFSYKRSPSRAS